MTDRSNDDIANALHGLSGGEPEPEPPSAAVPPAPLAPTSAPIPAPRPRPQPKPVGPQRPARPAAPGAAPVQRSNPFPSSPPRSDRPGTPGPARLPPQPAPVEPAEAIPSSSFEAYPSSSYADGETTNIRPVDDDDAVIIPAAPLSYLGHTSHAAHHPAPSAASKAVKAHHFRQTVTPPLLTAGVLLVATAVLKFLVHPDAILARLPVWLVALLLVSGAMVLAVGGLNMFQMRRYAAEVAPGRAPA